MEISKEQAMVELGLLKDYFQNQRKLSVQDAVLVMLNCLDWFGVNPVEIVRDLKEIKKEKDNRRRIA